MKDDDLFEKVSPAEAAKIRRSKGANGRWRPVLDALADGSILRVRIPMANVGSVLRREAHVLYPDKRLVSRKTDDPAFRYVWLVDA